MDIPYTQSQNAGPKTSGLDAAPPGIVGGDAIVQGANNLAQGLLVMAEQQRQLDQAEQIDLAAKHLNALGLESDTVWNQLQQDQLANPINPRAAQGTYEQFITARSKEHSESMRGTWAQKYFDTHVGTVMESRLKEVRTETYRKAVTYQTGQYHDRLQEFSDLVAKDPAQTSEYFKQAKAYIQGQSMALPIDAAKEWVTWRDGVTFNTARTLVIQNPGEFLSALKDGTYPTGASTGNAKWDTIHWNEIKEGDFTTLHTLAGKVIEDDRKGWEKQLFDAREIKQKDLADIMWGTQNPDTKALIPGQDASGDIQLSKNLLSGEKYSELLKENHQIQNARKAEVTEGKKTISDFARTRLLDLADRATFNPSMLTAIINEDVVKFHVFDKGDLLPDDATLVYTAIKSARLHQESGDSSTRRAEQTAMQTLQVFVPQLSTAKDATNLHLIQEDMERQFVSEMRATPDATAVQIQEMANTIRVHGEGRVLTAQKRNIDDLDKDLFGMEQLWQQLAPGLAGTGHQIDPAQRKRIEVLFPLLRGAFQLHDVRRQRWEYFTKVSGEQAVNAGGARGK
jgi:hypothetical protein